MFFNLEPVLEYNFFMNFIVSKRGAGKTFSSLKWLIENFIKTGEQFVYMRRTQAEIELALPTLFQPFNVEGMFTDHVLSVKGEWLYCDGEVMGRGMAISTAYKFKSVGFSAVKYILFDEFISETKTYVKDEVTKFLSAIETIGRMRDIKVICLANQITTFNPYYVYFNVRPESRDTPFTRFRDKSVLIHQFESQAYMEAKMETPFARLIAGTKYGSFMLENESIQDDYTLIDPLKGYKKTPVNNIIIGGRNIVVYDVEYDDRYILFFSTREPIAELGILNFDRTLLENATMESVSTHPLSKKIAIYTRQGRVRFRDMNAKLSIEELIL